MVLTEPSQNVTKKEPSQNVTKKELSQNVTQNPTKNVTKKKPTHILRKDDGRLTILSFGIIFIVVVIILTLCIIFIVEKLKCPNFLYDSVLHLCCNDLSNSGFYNSITASCESCGSGYLYDISSHNCVNSTNPTITYCPTGYQNVNGFCMPACMYSYLINYDLHSCCPYANNTGYYDISAQLCYTCPSGFQYSPGSTTCIPTCTGGAVYNGTVCQGCAAYLYNPFTVPPYCCPDLSGTGYFDISSNECNQCTELYEHANGAVYNNTMWGACIGNCDTGYTWNGYECQIDCSNTQWNAYDNTCCSTTQYYDLSSCVSCNSAMTGFNNSGYPGYDISNGFIYNTNYNSCIPVCDTGYTYTNGICLINCNEPYLLNISNNTCCDSSQYYDISSQLCSTCDLSFNNYGLPGYTTSNGSEYSESFNSCIPICNTGYTYEGNNTCVIDCSESYLVNYTDNICCVVDLSGTEYYNTTSESCATCDIGYEYSSLYSGCIINCPSGTTYINGYCLTSCGENLYNPYTNTCCDSSNGGYYDPSIDNCAYCGSDYSWSSGNQTCNDTQCQKGFTYDSATGLCALDCSAYLYNPNTLSCCNDFSGAGYFTTNNNNGVPSCAQCPNGEIYYASTTTGFGQCGVICPTGTSWDNGICTNFNCPAGEMYYSSINNCGVICPTGQTFSQYGGSNGSNSGGCVYG